MSIATLKKKSQALYNNLSVGQNQFSINGTTRSQGYIGQTSLSRSLIHTPHKGTVARGIGLTNNIDIKASETFSLEDNTVVKKSTLSTRGMLATKHRWINRPFPNTVVKADGGRIINDQTDYITRLKKKTLTEIESYCKTSDAVVGKKTCSTTLRTANGLPIFTKPKLSCTTSKDLTTVSHAKYILTLQDKCALQDNYKFVSPIQRTPLIGGN